VRQLFKIRNKKTYFTLTCKYTKTWDFKTRSNKSFADKYFRKNCLIRLIYGSIRNWKITQSILLIRSIRLNPSHGYNCLDDLMESLLRLLIYSFFFMCVYVCVCVYIYIYIYTYKEIDTESPLQSSDGE
jgi:hypothetical protein